MEGATSEYYTIEYIIPSLVQARWSDELSCIANFKEKGPFYYPKKSNLFDQPLQIKVWLDSCP